MQALTLKYRPATFEDLAGQRAVSVILRKMCATGQVPPALLFSGSRGTGKTSTARIVTAALNCQQPPGPCRTCPSCRAVAAGTSMDLLEVDAAGNGLVDDIRKLRDHVLYGTGGAWRVVILDEAHAMSSAAFNALLKVLEEPPPQTVFILATTEPHRVLDTVVSRCMSFTFTRLSVADIVERLDQITTAEGVRLEPALARLLAERADGAMRDAVMALDQAIRAGITTAQAYRDLIGDTDPGPALITAICGGELGTAYTMLDALLASTSEVSTLGTAMIETLRDVCVLHAGAPLTVQGPALTARQQLAARLSVAEVRTLMQVLWDWKTRFPPDQHRTGLELAIALIVARLHPTVTQPSTTSRRLSLSEMAALQ